MPHIKRYTAEIGDNILMSVEMMCRYVEAHLATQPAPLWPHQGQPWMYEFHIAELRTWRDSLEGGSDDRPPPPEQEGQADVRND